jgi:hypothetical protein
MDEEMNFPNPVVRTDLPTRRRKWPRVLLGVAVLGLLTIIFLPQILSSKVGRKFVVSYLTSKTNSTVTLESFKTSWFGGTSATFLSIADPMNRRMGFKSLKCNASLWNLLRGKYKLGETVIEGLNFDYVINDGRGSDSFERMRNAGSDGAPASPGGGNFLPELSGKITINSGTIVLNRGTVQPKLYNVTWEQGRLENVEATFDIQALDRPWTYTLAADTVEGNAERGTISSNGTVDLGDNGQADAKKLKLDLTLTGEKVRVGSLGAALIPASTPRDVREALGDVLDKIDMAVKAADGTVTFVRCEASGPMAKVSIKPTIDLAATPAVLGVADGAAGTISMGVSKSLAEGWLVYLNPFFHDAIGGRGSVTLTIEQLRLPLDKQGVKAATAQGRLSAKDVVLDRKDEMTAAQALPDNLASQLALMTGDSQKEVMLTVDGKFAVAGGQVVMAGPMVTSVHDTTLMLEGSTDLDSGSLKLLAALGNAPAITSRLQNSRPGVAIPIGGTIRQPQLGVFGLKGELADASLKSLNDGINEQITRMRAKETQRMMQKSENQVKEILRPLQAPVTMPAGK